MADFLLIVVAALVVAAVVFGVAVFALGHDTGLSAAEPAGAYTGPPADRPLTVEDLVAARFDVVLRGYRMDQVDALLARAADELRQLQERADSLEAELAGGQAVHDGDLA